MRRNNVFFLYVILLALSMKGFSQTDSIVSVKKLVETTNDGISCFSFKITDVLGNEIKVPPPLFRELKCLEMGVMFSPDFRYVVFSNTDTLRLYDFQKDSLSIIMLLPKETDGRHFEGWTQKGKRFMFSDINQKKYPELAKIYIFDFNAGKCENFMVIDAAFDFTCGSDCFSNSGAIWFEGEDLLKYKRNINLQEDPGKIVSINLNE